MKHVSVKLYSSYLFEIFQISTSKSKDNAFYIMFTDINILSVLVKLDSSFYFIGTIIYIFCKYRQRLAESQIKIEFLNLALHIGILYILKYLPYLYQ